MYGDSPERGAITAKVIQSTVAQAKEVNKRRLRLNKEILSVSDICNMVLRGKICGAKGLKYLPIVITEVSLTCKGNRVYGVETKHGVLNHKYQHQELHYMPLLTKKLLSTDEESDIFCEKLLSEQTALSLYSVVDITGKCKCKGDFGARCSKCAAGVRKYFAHQRCTLCTPMSQDVCASCNEEA